MEVIVVDDGSTNHTARLVQQYPSVRYSFQTNTGLPRARNAGWRRCSGEYVVFLDADDRLVSDAASIGVSYLGARPDCAFVSGEHRYIDADGQVANGAVPIMSQHYEALLRGNYIGMVATVMFRRTALEHAQGFNPRWRACEDYDLYLRLARKFPVLTHGLLVAEYRRYGSAMSDDPARMLRAALGVLRNQRKWVRGDITREVALATGIDYWRAYLRPPTHGGNSSSHRKGQRLHAARLSVALARYAPSHLASILR